MINFNDFVSGLNQATMESPSVQVASKSTSHILFLKIDKNDVVTRATYSGPINHWLGSLCTIITGKALGELTTLCGRVWDQSFEHDLTFWDLKSEKDEDFFFAPLELLGAAVDMYRGREYLYKDPEALICRCFGVRENDVLNYIRSTDDPTPEGLATISKAGMGCRSCVPQLTRWLSIKMPKAQSHFYKEKSRAHWLLEIDYMLNCFPESESWKMEVKNFQGTQVLINFDKDVSQVEIEKVSVELQDFLGAALDSDLSFFLIRARHLSNA